MAKIDKASIYVRLCRLRHRLKKMQFFMAKKDRIVYGTPSLEYCNECLRDFVLAYEFQDERAFYYRKLIADFAVLKIELEGINHEGILRCPKNKECSETIVDLPPDTDRMYLAMFQIVGEIDEDISKWRQSALRSKNTPDKILQ